MDEAPTQVELLVLRIIDKMENIRNDYWLERFFAKTDICLSINDEKRLLVKKGWLSSEHVDQIKYYAVTTLGKEVLQMHYNTDAIQQYVMNIEPTGFVLHILRLIDENEND